MTSWDGWHIGDVMAGAGTAVERVFVIAMLSTSSTSKPLRSCRRSPARGKVEAPSDEGK